MKYILTSVITIIFFILVVFIFYFIYEQNKILRDYKHEVFGTREDYKELKTEYETYVSKTKNLRSVIILSNTQNSLHIQIGNTLYQYAGRVDGDISVYYKNLVTREEVTIDGDRKYYMASLYKVPLTLYALDEIEKGNLSLDSKVDGITLTDALNKIITESNNEYAQTLAEQLGWQNIEKAIEKKYGISVSLNEKLETTVKNMGVLFEDIALSLKTNEAESNYLLQLLKAQKKTSKLPKYLPSTIYSHNKTGEFNNYSHDAGIFYTPKANYILIFMSDTKNPSSTDEQMALMSKKLYDILASASSSAILSTNSISY